MKLKRVVEMYQWTETKEDGGEGGEDKFTYNQEWLDFPRDSSGYNSQWYTNPPFPVKREMFYSDVNLGNYLLAKNQIDQL
jgi:hypothetical protein